MSKRTFKGSKKRIPFTHETSLTDAEAIAALAGRKGDEFAASCAFEIGKMANGMKHRAGLVAWGFRLADSPPSNSGVAVKLLASVLAAETGKPFKGLTPAGNTVVVRHLGPKSPREGSYSISNGGAYRSPEAVFYGYATPEGEWSPTGATPEGIVNFLTRE